MAEFTGERVIPGRVDPDLWNEHFARYLFASRLSRQRRVLDLACGSGYGSAELAREARLVVGLDNSAEAVAYARASYAAPNLHFLNASASAVPLRDSGFDLVTAFELIEHLSDWQCFLQEARRLLAPGGQFIVSTPNKLYYAEARRLSGPNPFHVHEFAFDEFRDALADVFPHVSLFVQNHADGVVFQPLQGTTASDLRMESSVVDAATSHFFVAVCAMTSQTGGPTFVYLPTAANVLREREQHIRRLELEVAQKTQWLERLQHEHKAMVELHDTQKEELEARNRWAEQLNRQLEKTGARVVALQEEVAAEHLAATETAARYTAKIAELEADNAAKARWAIETEQRLTAELEGKSQELAQCVELLDRAERTVEERTLWAQRLDRERAELETKLSLVQASRWYRMGRRIGLGPEVRNT